MAREGERTAGRWFGEDVPGIALGHTVPFFAEIASDYFGTLIAAGVEFLPLVAALTGAQQAVRGAGSSPAFLVLRHNLTDEAGRPLPRIAPEVAHLHARVVEMAGIRTD